MRPRVLRNAPWSASAVLAASADYRLRVLAQTTTGGKVPVFLDIVRVVKGRAEVTATFQDVNQAVPAAVERRAISSMLGRL